MKQIKFDHSFVLSRLHLLFPKQIIINVLQQHLFAMCPCLFITKHLFCLSHRKAHWTMSMDSVGLKNVIWEPRTPWPL